MTPPVAAAAEEARLTWSERNQRWLSQRFAFWRERLECGKEGAPEPRDPSLDNDASDFQPAAMELKSLFGLTQFETELLVLAAGMEIDVALRQAVAHIETMPGAATPFVSLSLALQLLPQSHWDVVSPLRPLRYWSLAAFDTRDGLAQARVRIDERVLHYLTSVPAFDERLRGIARFEEGTADAADAALAAEIARELDGPRAPIVMLTDAMSDDRRRRAARGLARAVFGDLSLRTLSVQTTPDAGDAIDIARLLDREAALSGAGLLVTVGDDPVQGAQLATLLHALNSPIITLGALNPSQLPASSERTVLRFSVPAPAVSRFDDLRPAVQRAARRAAHQFQVSPMLLDQALATVNRCTDDTAVDARLWSLLRHSARGELDTHAQRIDSPATLDDLVVPAAVMVQLRSVASQLRHRETVYEKWGFGERHPRGLGIAVLFTGESGTGKTMAAEALANDAELDLYRIDLSSVVSKYIGETEKNLSQVFAAAERSGAVLLFDEADALFGKRSEVKDSHDRYANIEVSYLLQRMESYRGLAILTTNIKTALDTAFQRRLRFVVHFPFPGPEEREAIWRRVFPASMPRQGLDYPKLARLHATGGHIRNVALNAAFIAAESGDPVSMVQLRRAAHQEATKRERPLNPAETEGWA